MTGSQLIAHLWAALDADTDWLLASWNHKVLYQEDGLLKKGHAQGLMQALAIATEQHADDVRAEAMKRWEQRHNGK